MHVYHPQLLCSPHQKISKEKDLSHNHQLDHNHLQKQEFSMRRGSLFSKERVDQSHLRHQPLHQQQHHLLLHFHLLLLHQKLVPTSPTKPQAPPQYMNKHDFMHRSLFRRRGSNATDTSSVSSVSSRLKRTSRIFNWIRNK